jgi:hypothetical protein
MNKADFVKFKKDIIVICDYLSIDEKRHFEEMDKPKNHIWRYINRVKKRLRSPGEGNEFIEK